MKRFKLNRKEKFLFATPLLIPLLVLAWPLVSADSLDRKLRELAGPQAIDCGFVGLDEDYWTNSCAVMAFKAGKPFMLRQDVPPDMNRGMARTPQGQFYTVDYIRSVGWKEKSYLHEGLRLSAGIVLYIEGNSKEREGIYCAVGDKTATKTTYVWR